MKTYSFEKLDYLLNGKGAKTLKTKEINNDLNTVYLDKLNNGEFAVSIDEDNQGIFDTKSEAEKYYNTL